MTPEKRGALIHSQGKMRSVVLHHDPNSPQNDVVEYRFSPRLMAGFLVRKVFGEQSKDVKPIQPVVETGFVSWPEFGTD